MLLGEPRKRLIFIALAGMEMACFTPVLLLVAHWMRGDWSPATVFALTFSSTLVYLLLLDGLSYAGLAAPYYQLAAVGLILLSTLAAVRAVAYPELPLGDLSWIGAASRALFDWRGGPKLELVLILVNAFLWQRAANATSRNWHFIKLGEDFQWGIFWLAITGGLLGHFSGQKPLALVWIYFTLGLASLLLARVDERAHFAHSIGGQGDRMRLGQNALLLMLTIAIAVALGLFFSPANTYRLLQPLGVTLSYLYILLLLVITQVAQIVIPALVTLLTLLWGNETLEPPPIIVPALIPDTQAETDPGAAAVVELLAPAAAFIVRALGVLLAAGLLLGGILLVLRQVRPGRLRRRDERELIVQNRAGLSELLGELYNGLRDIAEMAQRFGMSRELLDAVSVQNIYANLCRLAALRGLPRPMAEPPDIYLHTLQIAFPEHAPALSHITHAYMRVHYGDQPISHEELGQLKADYAQIRAGIAQSKE